MKFYIVFTQLLRNIGVMLSPEQIVSVNKKCLELEESIRTIAKEEAQKVAAELLLKEMKILKDSIIEKKDTSNEG